MKVKLDHSDLFLMTTSTVRYALGRMSYIVSTSEDIVKKIWPELSVSERGVIIRDVQEALEQAGQRGVPLGMEMDHQIWKLLLGWMKEHRDDAVLRD